MGLSADLSEWSARLAGWSGIQNSRRTTGLYSIHNYEDYAALPKEEVRLRGL